MTFCKSGLVDPTRVYAWEVFDSWIVPMWSLKNKELFRIGLDNVDCQRVGGVPFVDCPHIES